MKRWEMPQVSNWQYHICTVWVPLKAQKSPMAAHLVPSGCSNPPEDVDELVLEELLLEEDELELLLELDELLPGMIFPIETVSVTRSSLAPSSRLLIRSV